MCVCVSACLRVCEVFNYTCMYMQVCKYCVVCALLYSAVFLMLEILTDTVLQAFDLTHDHYLSLCTCKCHNALIFDRVNFNFLTGNYQKHHPSKFYTMQYMCLYMCTSRFICLCVCMCMLCVCNVCTCVCSFAYVILWLVDHSVREE